MKPSSNYRVRCPLAENLSDQEKLDKVAQLLELADYYLFHHSFYDPFPDYKRDKPDIPF